MAVELREGTRTFAHVVAVRDLDLQLEPGRIYGLLGPNGSGKSTTLKLSVGLLSPDSGHVALFGGGPTDQTRARVGYVPEQRALPEQNKVWDLLVFYARMRGFTKTDAQRRAAELLETFELSDRGQMRVKELSNGQQQKVQISLALLTEPDLLLLDEPLAALDPEHQEQVNRQIRAAAARGAAVILSTHRLREAQDIVDHVVMMHQGAKVLDAPLDQALGSLEPESEGAGTLRGVYLARVAALSA